MVVVVVVASLANVDGMCVPGSLCAWAVCLWAKRVGERVGVGWGAGRAGPCAANAHSPARLKGVRELVVFTVLGCCSGNIKESAFLV